MGMIAAQLAAATALDILLLIRPSCTLQHRLHNGHEKAVALAQHAASPQLRDLLNPDDQRGRVPPHHCLRS
jgi:hypothetical protein